MAKRLFVGGLPYATTEEELKDIFAKVGELASVTLIKDRFTGQSKGFAFVEYVNDADADKAIETLNGTPLGDSQRPIAVNVARPMEERKPREYGGGDRGGYRGGDRGGYGGGGGGGDRRGGYSGRSAKRW